MTMWRYLLVNSFEVLEIVVISLYNMVYRIGSFAVADVANTFVPLQHD
jgi:hypothetical protein